jgi:hypothetical protein
LKKILLLLFCSLIALVTHAQSQGRFAMKGIVTDTSGNGLPEATVMLLLPKDSSLVNFGRTAKDGSFEFKNLKRIAYLLKVSYVGYLPYQQHVNPNDGEVTNLGKLGMKFLNQDLYEVVIKTARAPLSIRGDTVEYDPRAFKVPPGSTVEDLIRKLPGMQVDADGNIKAQGETVKRVTVDGKRFFGDDPKMATKNLPAEAINKVQVFNGKSEQSKATGVDDGKREKTVNLELKDSHKKGGFGKAIAGVGTDSRLEGKVSYNRFDDKQQFSVLGFGNNTNQSGISSNDYQDFKGSQSFNWGDDGDFGFSSGIRFGSEGDGITIGPSYGNNTKGFTKNWAGGANYNFDTKKTKLSTSYFYNSTDAITDVRSSQENFLNNTTYRSTDNNKTNAFTGNHRPSFRLEKVLDSLNTIILISNSRINNGNSTYDSFQQYYRSGDTLSNRSNIDNNSLYNSFAMSNLLLYRHKFRKKGRNFAASVGYNINNSDGSANQNSVNEFFLDPSQNSTIRQRNNINSDRSQFKGSLSYVEPFAKTFFWETFYNFSLRKDEVDKNVFDVKEDGLEVNRFLTRYYTNNFNYNRIGSSIRYSNKGLNLAVGVAAQKFELKGKFGMDQTSADFTRVKRNYSRVVPNVSMTYDLKRNRYLFMEYGQSIQEPTISDLQPVVDNSNPLNIFVGNPNLTPQSSHNLFAGYNMFNPASFTNLFVNVQYNYYVDQIVYNKTVDENLVTTTTPMNVSGGSRMGTYVYFGFPLKKTKLTMNVNGGISYSDNPIYINNVVNKTETDAYNFGLRLDLTPSDVFTLYSNANWSIANTSYSINTGQNQRVLSANYSGDMNVKMPREIYFNARFNFNTYANNQFGFSQKQPILNLSVYKIVLKNKRGEVRLTANDVFKKNLGITQTATSNYYMESRVRTLSRYFMLSFTYNMRGMSASVKRSNNF